MDPGHRYVFAALSVLDLTEHSWTCQAIDGIKNNPKWDNVTAYGHTNAVDAILNYNGPYSINFTIDDAGTTIELQAVVNLNSATATLSQIIPAPPINSLPNPSNKLAQIDPGIDDDLGSQVWFRFQDSNNKMRELRFHTPLNSKDIAGLLTNGTEWLAKHLMLHI